MTSHLEEGTLHDLLDGEIPSAQLPPIQAHLAACEACRARLAEARDILGESDRLVEVLDLSGISAAPKPGSPVFLPGRPWTRNLAWAATLAMAVALGYYGRGGGAPAPRENLATATAPPAVDSPPIAQPTAVEARPPVRVDPPTPRVAMGKATSTDPPRESSERRSADQLAAPAAPPSGLVQRMNEAVATSGIGGTPAIAATTRALSQRLEFTEAIRRLGGTLRLVEGLVPDRIEAVGPEVHVVYPLSTGELVLTQQLLNGRVVVRLVAPPGFPADSLQRLRDRIRE